MRIKLASQTLRLGSMALSLIMVWRSATAGPLLQDEAKLFSAEQAEAVQKALVVLKETTGGQVEFLTLRGLPGRGEIPSDALSDKKLSDSVEAWATPKRARLGPQDLWLVVSVKPEYLFLSLGDGLKVGGNFGPEKNNEVIRTLARGFKSQSYVEATLEALGLINRFLQPARVGEAERIGIVVQRGQIFWIWLLGGLAAALLGYWLAPRFILSSSSAS